MILGLLQRLIGVMVNLEWLEAYAESGAEFLVPGILDHSPAVVSIFEGRFHFLLLDFVVFGLRSLISWML